MMKPINTAVITKTGRQQRETETRARGYFSYPVPDFAWQYFFLGKNFTVDTHTFKEYGFRLLVHEDGGNWGTYLNHYTHIAMLSFDSTLSEQHFKERYKQAEQADLVLIDHDDLDRYAGLGKPVYRFAYCVNDHLFKDLGEERTIDVCFHCGKNETRRALNEALSAFCQRQGYSYRWGGLPHIEYAAEMAHSKIVVNWPRTPMNRPHRVFDAMACGACLVTGKLPEVSGDLRIAGHDYIEVDDFAGILAAVDDLLKSGRWQEIARNGYKLVMRHHTWDIRAKQLREIIKQELSF